LYHNKSKIATPKIIVHKKKIIQVNLVEKRLSTGKNGVIPRKNGVKVPTFSHYTQTYEQYLCKQSGLLCKPANTKIEKNNTNVAGDEAIGCR
jgi:hypothetical protein